MQTVKLTSRREVAPAVYELLFTRPEGWTFDAGQFARIGLATDGDEPVFRAYSIAGSPKDEGTLGAWKKHILVIGARTREEVDRLAAYAESEARIPLTILMAASREAGELTGRIPALIESGALEAKAGAAFTPESARLLLCGNPDFIRETRALMKARGIVSPRLGKPGQLLVESLW